MVQATGGSAVIAIGSGCVSDIATPGERGRYMGLFSALSMAGPAIASHLRAWAAACAHGRCFCYPGSGTGWHPFVRIELEMDILDSRYWMRDQLSGNHTVSEMSKDRHRGSLTMTSWSWQLSTRNPALYRGRWLTTKALV